MSKRAKFFALAGSISTLSFLPFVFTPVLIFLSLSGRANAQAIKIKGEDVRSSTSIGTKLHPKITFQGSEFPGDIVLAWYADNNDDIVFRLFDKYLNAKSVPDYGDNEKQVNLPLDQSWTSSTAWVALDSYNDGSFVLAWGGKRGTSTEDSIFIQRIDPDGTFNFDAGEPEKNQAIEMSLEPDLNSRWMERTNLALSQGDPLLPSTWHGFVNWTQVYAGDADNVYGTLFHFQMPDPDIYTFTPLEHIDPSGIGDASDFGGDIAIGPNGEFIVTWDIGAPEYEIRFQKFDDYGSPVGEMGSYDYREGHNVLEFFRTSVAIDDENRILIAWSQHEIIEDELGHTRDDTLMYVRRYDQFGSFDRQFEGFQGTYEVWHAYVPQVANFHIEGASPDDYYIFVWVTNAADNHKILYGRIIDENGNERPGYEGIFRG
jgi:hypothetical protein